MCKWLVDDLKYTQSTAAVELDITQSTVSRLVRRGRRVEKEIGVELQGVHIIIILFCFHIFMNVPSLPMVMNDQVLNIQSELRQLSNEKIAEHSQRFFKTGNGQYGEGDKFLGIRVPTLRRLAKKYRGISIGETSKLLKSQFHEERLLSLLLLVGIFKNANKKGKEAVYRLYINNTKFINNWDIIDCSAEHIVGAYLRGLDKQPIYNLANSESLWERRISIMSTFHFIKNNEFIESINVSKVLLHDKEDLIHKAVGWMLREIGKRDIKVEEEFLKAHYRSMPRTMLRYAIERFPEKQRKKYLRGDIRVGGH